MTETTNEPKCRAEALSLANSLKSFKFLVTLVIWYDLLVHINLASKLMQQQNLEMNNAIGILEKTHTFLIQFKETGFSTSLAAAKDLAEELEMSPDEMVIAAEGSIRRRQRRKQFSYEGDDESIQDPTDNFRITFFLVLMDQAIMSFKERFDQLKRFEEMFGFLFNLRQFDMLSPEACAALRQKCHKLEQILSSRIDSSSTETDDLRSFDSAVTDRVSDIDGLTLFDELRTMCNILPDTVKSPLDILRYVHANHLHELFPNVSVALRILLTVPVTVASGERSFSKLKLIKTYLRANMTQQRLVGLAMLSIENGIATQLDFSNLLTTFANSKARKVFF